MASVVSIMIIMVVMEGTRIKNAPVKVSLAASPAAKELEKELAGEQALRSDVLRVEGETRAVAAEGVKRGLQRDALATMVAAVEHKIQERRQQLDGSQASGLRSGPRAVGIAVPTGATGSPAGASGKRAGCADRD